jgi:hypothetical protein
MKIFLSWSGEISHKVAVTFRDWLPSVIQSITPYVSSEDIDKGARWSTDIAKELEDSTFGILCVTKDNINAPWLNFEAGALSKTMGKSLVSPFLFDIKRSEVDGPILQFQSTIFEKEDIKKLVSSLNKACENGQLSEERLENTFNVWYSSLEKDLNGIKEIVHEQPSEDEQSSSKENSVILEEILELTRINQKLIRNPDGDFDEAITKINESVNNLSHKITRILDLHNHSAHYRNINPLFFDDVFHSTGFRNGYLGVRIILSLLREDFPWIYETGIEVIEVLKSRKNKQDKFEAIEEFNRLLELSYDHPMFRELYMKNKDMRMIFKEITRSLMRVFESSIGNEN